MLTLHKDIPILHSRVGKDETLFLNRLWACIEQNGKTQGFGVQQLARCMKLGRVQLNRRLQALTGQSPVELIMHYRMNTAAQLLRSGHATVKEIAWQCGFARQGNFCRSFQQAFKCSPLQYRGNHSNSSSPAFCWKIPLGENDFLQLLHIARQKSWLAQLLETVLGNIGNNTLTSEQLAAITCMSPCSLRRNIKAAFNTSLQRLVRDIKLQYACELLAAGQGSVADVAYSAGFYDAAHFSRCFSAAFGCKPSGYRHIGTGISMRWLKEQLMNQNDK